jgi:PKHD-type hydroxylase
VFISPASDTPLSRWTSYLPVVATSPVLSVAGCERLVADLSRIPGGSGEVYEQNQKSRNAAVRQSRVRWLDYGDTTKDLFTLIHRVAREVNERTWQMDIVGFTEPVQFAEYAPPGGHYTWHVDVDNDALSVRKISVILQLSAPESYDGGDVEFFCGAEPGVGARTQGIALLFPSYVLHRVTPVTRGVRHSIVSWISGPHFR